MCEEMKRFESHIEFLKTLIANLKNEKGKTKKKWKEIELDDKNHPLLNIFYVFDPNGKETLNISIEFVIKDPNDTCHYVCHKDKYYISHIVITTKEITIHEKDIQIDPLQEQFVHCVFELRRLIKHKYSHKHIR